VAAIGLQLYTVREECARDFRGTLAAVAEIGYSGVELVDLYGCSAVEVRGWLDELGLVACARHTSLDALENGLSQLGDDARALGHSRLVVGWMEPPASAADAETAQRRIERAAAEVARRGLELGYHNHDGELRALEDGRSFLDRLLDAPLFLELDLGWVWWAGADPVELLERARGRSPLVHVKDFRTRGERSFCPVGDGAVGYERLAPAAEDAGAEWLLVEQDETAGSALDAIQRSLAALTAFVS
jgi:sugar phosphate isomerase/epimerase